MILEQVNCTEENLKNIENTEQKEEKLIRELKDKQRNTAERLAIGIKTFTPEKIKEFKDTLNDRKSAFFGKINISASINNEISIKQIGNIVFFNSENDRSIIDNIYALIKENKQDNERPIFYIISGEAHWYVIAQQGEKIFNLNVSSIGNDNDLLFAKLASDKESTGFKYSKYNTKNKKLQYSSGCCEMYCILLPYILNRCMFFNNIEDMESLFTFNSTGKKNNIIKTFDIPFLYNGLCEKAFSADVGENGSRSSLLEKQKKEIDDSPVSLFYNDRVTFQDIFSGSLKSEIDYLKYMQKDFDETKWLNMKGGFIYRYAILMSYASDMKYREHLQKYFEIHLEELCQDEKVKDPNLSKEIRRVSDEEKEYFKKNFQRLLSQFSKLFLGDQFAKYIEHDSTKIDLIENPSEPLAEPNHTIPIINISRQTLNGRNETINEQVEDLWRHWESEANENGKFDNHEIFGNSKRGEFLDDNVIKNILQNTFQREIPIIVPLSLSEEFINDNFNYNTIPNNIIINTGAHFIPVNIRLIQDHLYFMVSDSFSDEQQILNNSINSIYTTLQRIYNSINESRPENNENEIQVSIINLYDQVRQQNMLTEDQTIRDKNTCAIWAAINTADMQNISNEQFLKIVQQTKAEDTKLQTPMEHDVETAEHEVADLFCVLPATETSQPLAPGPLQEDTTILAKEAKIKTDNLKEEKQSKQTSKSNTI